MIEDCGCCERELAAAVAVVGDPAMEFEAETMAGIIGDIDEKEGLTEGRAAALAAESCSDICRLVLESADKLERPKPAVVGVGKFLACSKLTGCCCVTSGGQSSECSTVVISGGCWEAAAAAAVSEAA